MKSYIGKKIFDYHVHIGQFESIYYNPYKVVEVLSHYNIAGAYVSSTTSCIRWNDIDEKKIIINHIKSEFDELFYSSQKNMFDGRPLCWVIPQRYYEGDSVEEMYSECEYMGFKIHPRAHEWNLHSEKTHMLLDDICRVAGIKKIPIFIHTGICHFELPSRFEHWFERFPDVTFILAHCKAVDEVIGLFDKYNNLYGDVAFSSVDSLKKIFDHKYSRRMLFGSDFPITNFKFGMEFYEDKELYENYRIVMSEWKKSIYDFGNIL